MRVRGVDGDEARVRATFQIRASDDQEADRIFGAARLVVHREPGAVRLEHDTRQPFGVAAAVALLSSRTSDVTADLEIEVPTGAQLWIEGVGADIHVEGVHGEQRYRTVSGDLLVADSSGSMTLGGVSGDATIRGSGEIVVRSNSVSGDLSVVAPLLRELRSTSVSGDIEIEGAFDAGGEHRVETVSGDLTLALLGGLTIDLRGLAGSVDSELDHRLEGRIGRRQLVVGDGRAALRFSSMSGDLQIVRPRRLSTAATAPAAHATTERDDDEARHLEVLRAVERGEIDVEEAARRLEHGHR